MTIELQNITKLYGEQKALDQVSLTINKGEITGLLGPNGAGKSTIMKIISCFLPPSSGEARVYGFDVMEEPLKVKAKIGYLPEHNPLYPEMYVREYLHYVAGIYKMKDNIEERINKVIELTGLKVEQNKKIGALSKGYRQRVGLAQSLIHEPEILILDEPTTGLDPNQLVEIRDLIKSIGKEKTVLLSTHIMQEVEAICDRVIIINNGKIVADDATSKLSKLLGNTETIQIEMDKKVELSELNKIKGVTNVIKINDLSFEIIASGDEEIRKSLFQWAVKSDIQILSMNKKDSNLEHVFHQLTKA
ncbi:MULTISPECIES: gliding motility-associated ABC transporter ATP-binding subunit GldA [unclassified Lentimicrobium]|uniref:gliding motility-associated ABC transporter ATP-binding subunit GldA n=1 Tax=unclassified Lentimicrobium TaxID=2677434 RepID=UPI0015541038|nr:MULTISPECIES: gliding motility-associated ABC transporter ATP-binding subunit GldA [unclassified Lentimicrobium]NPD48026.1 gliding motility-associated ABC transporter ATP-binding subunit GldA [Lentimicrobium sp. S6]NPD86594.1 gliding motility-associated ABC transporter ATP-binding subunit GldA [Lentimicrobium sp. L6]